MDLSKLHLRLDVDDISPSNRDSFSVASPLAHVPLTLHRFASPSGPWPWHGDLDREDQYPISPVPSRRNSLVSPAPPDLHDTKVLWKDYPKALFPNWTSAQVKRCGIGSLIKQKRDDKCTVYAVEITKSKSFQKKKVHVLDDSSDDNFWEFLHGQRSEDMAIQCLFVDCLSGHVLQMLGTRYNIEPFFFSSFLNRIPSCYQEDPTRQSKTTYGDHITIILPFVRVDKSKTHLQRPASDTSDAAIVTPEGHLYFHDLDGSEHKLVIDLLSVHLLRSNECSTMITIHPHLSYATSAKELHDKVWLAGRSVYWSKIFNQTSEPSFVLLTLLWHVLYMWDEAMDLLYRHICFLESEAIDKTDMELTKTLHAIRARLPHYDSLLDQFKKSIEFVLDKSNIAIEHSDADEDEISRTKKLMKRECDILLSEVERLKLFRVMLDKRLGNVMNLVFSIINIQDSIVVRQLSEAALRDSEAMKQISYLTMLFLPATYATGIFGMNVSEINPGTRGTIVHYLLTAIPLTAITVWVILAFQSKRLLDNPDVGILSHLTWPVTLPLKLIQDRQRSKAQVMASMTTERRSGVLHNPKWFSSHQKRPDLPPRVDVEKAETLEYRGETDEP